MGIDSVIILYGKNFHLCQAMYTIKRYEERAHERDDGTRRQRLIKIPPENTLWTTGSISVENGSQKSINRFSPTDGNKKVLAVVTGTIR